MNRAIVITLAVVALVLVWSALYYPSGGDLERAERSEPAEGVDAPQPVAEPSAPAVQPVPSAAPAPQPAPAAAPPQPPPAIEPRRATAQDGPPEMRPEVMGPVEELKVAYQRDARDADAGALEQRIRDQFEKVQVNPGLVRSISCVKSVCKLEMRWTAADREAYLLAMMNLVSHVSQKIAAEPVGPDEGQAERPVDVYVSRVEPPYDPSSGRSTHTEPTP